MRGGALPYGVDTLVLRVEWPVAVRRGYAGRMWRMRPLGQGRPRRSESLEDAAEAGESISQQGDGGVNHSNLPSVGSETAGTQSEQAVDSGAVHQIQFTFGRSQPLPLLPVFFPGTPENNDFVKSAIEGLDAVRRALETVLHAEKSDELPQLKDLTRLSKGEIKALGKTDDDAHRIKKTGGRGIDLYKDKKGNIYIADMNGVGEPTPTGLNIKDFK